MLYFPFFFLPNVKYNTSQLVNFLLDSQAVNNYNLNVTYQIQIMSKQEYKTIYISQPVMPFNSNLLISY
jgi:hypothetical protein